MRSYLVVLFTAIACNMPRASVARADLPPEPVVRLTLRPVATTEPSVQYKLLPDLLDQTPGNAATLYVMASKLGPADPKEASELMDQVSDYLDVPLSELPRDKAEQVLAKYATRLRMADLAAHREEAQWDYSLREEGVNALLPHLNDMRGFANGWSLQSRLRIRDNDWPAAARTISDGLSMARQLNRQAVLVQGLVAAGIADETLARGVTDWISHGDAPNLYWSLSSLPEPFIDVHEVARWDKPMVAFTFPMLRDAAACRDDPGPWRAFVLRLPAVTENQKGDPPTTGLKAAILVAMAYPQARAHLLSRGHTPAQVDAMSVDRVVGTYFSEQYERLSNDAWRAWELPFWEGRADLQARLSAVESERHRPGGNPLLNFVPQLWRVRYQFARVDREIALLRVVEAVRDYAARHGGQPPRGLDEIKDLPVPIDPLRGQPFRYEEHGQDVTIEAPPFDENPGHGKRYELTIAR